MRHVVNDKKFKIITIQVKSRRCWKYLLYTRQIIVNKKFK